MGEKNIFLVGSTEEEKLNKVSLVKKHSPDYSGKKKKNFRNRRENELDQN